METLNAEDLAWWETHGTVQWLAPGTVIIAEGTRLDALFLLRQGEVKIRTTDQGGDPTTSSVEARLSPTLLGELSYLEGRVTVVSVIAQSRCQVVTMAYDLFEQQLKRDRSFALRFYHGVAKLLAQRLREVSLWRLEHPLRPSSMLRQALLFFAILEDRDLDTLIHLGQLRRLAAGEQLLAQGQPVLQWSLILGGQLQVTITKDGVDSIVETLGAGEILGELSLLEDLPASASVHGLQPSYILSLEKDVLWGILREQDGFARRFYQALAVVLADRMRQTLYQRGLSVEGQQGDATRLGEEEMSLERLDRMGTAATRFEWLRCRVGQFHGVRVNDFT
ncbi:MAG: cyclic nucleotide-binding domain-containing protein [Coleofasciculaceae cyanobacterium RL_1_1]|nr:cyclic nucleotide-binding domain-containing protein [Coleofasciculaceae cyanobacterium RL_1_1]